MVFMFTFFTQPNAVPQNTECSFLSDIVVVSDANTPFHLSSFHLFSHVTLRCIQYSSGSHKCLQTHHIFYCLRASQMLPAQSSLKTLTSPAVAASQTPAFNIFKGAADLFRAIANIMMQRIFSKKIYRGILLKIFFFRCKNLTRLDATNTNISTEVKILFKQKII